MKNILRYEWAKKVLQASYNRVIIDEYQDCLRSQHEIFVAMNDFLPIVVLGDPLQGIFDFGGELANWEQIPFQRVEIETKPWRWQDTNPSLGAALTILRQDLLSPTSEQTKTIDLTKYGSCIELLPPNPKTTDIMQRIAKFKNSVYLTPWPRQQLKVSQTLPCFQYDETRDLDDLFIFTKQFDNSNDAKLIYHIIIFASQCATNISKEFGTYMKHLHQGNFDFGKITKNRDFGDLILSLRAADKLETILHIMEWFYKWFKGNSHLYRKELFVEMGKSVRAAKRDSTTITETAEHIKSNSRITKPKPQTRFLSSRTLLSKGLEFDCVILDLTDWPNIDTKNFYVALTRAKQKIFIISGSSKIKLIVK